MDSTGTQFANTFFLIIMLLPLAPVLLVFLSGKYDAEPLNFLVLVCLLDLMKGLSDRLSILNTDNQHVIINIVSLLEWVALIQLFKTSMSPFVRRGLNIFLVAFLSSLLTYFFLEGWERHSPVLDTLEGGVMIGVIIVSILPLIRHRMLQIFRSPLFWIAGGTLFYLLLFILVEWAGPCCQPGTDMPTAENSILLSIAGLIRYGLYFQAVLVCRRPGAGEEVRDWGA
jgi:hypothetical protein